MSASSSSIAPRHWSSCSIDQLNLAFHHGMNYCLKYDFFFVPTCVISCFVFFFINTEINPPNYLNRPFAEITLLNQVNSVIVDFQSFVRTILVVMLLHVCCIAMHHVQRVTVVI
jgi:hypothetical protein